MKSVSSLIYNKLIKFRIKHAFIYSGGAIMPLVDRFYKNKIKYYVSSNEFCLGSSAVGFAKSSNKTGVCITTSGPGLTNCVTPILDAKADSVPLLIISGQVPLSAVGTDAFQEAPSVDITKSITKFSYCIKNKEEINEVMDYAYYIANDRKKGPVHIDIPKCILTSTIDENKLTKNIKKDTQKINENQQKIINEIVKVINNSNKPVIYAGKGCNNASKELTKFVDKSNIPITTTLLSLGCYDERKPLALQMLGMHGNYAANMAIQNADCIIAIGSRFDDRCTGNLKQYAPNCKNIIHINIEPSEINKIVPSNLNLVMDSKIALKKMLKDIKYMKREKWLDQIDLWKEIKFKYEIGINLKAQEVIEKLNQLITNKSKYLFTTGVGNHQMYTAQFITFTHPKQLITSGSLGVMGTCLPYAIGMKIANPNKEIIAIDGDGSFNMSLCDLKTLVTYGINIKIIVMNNSSQDMVRCWEDLFFEQRNTATQVINPCFTSLAQAYGIKSLELNKRSDLDTMCKQFLEYKGSILMNVIVDKDYCFPLVKPGNALDNMLLEPVNMGNSKEIPS